MQDVVEMCDDALSNLSGMDTSLAAKSSYLEVSKFSGKPYASCFDITTGLRNPRHPTLVARVLHYASCSKLDAKIGRHTGSEL